MAARFSQRRQTFQNKNEKEQTRASMPLFMRVLALCTSRQEETSLFSVRGQRNFDFVLIRVYASTAVISRSHASAQSVVSTFSSTALDQSNSTMAELSTAKMKVRWFPPRRKDYCWLTQPILHHQALPPCENNVINVPYFTTSTTTTTTTTNTTTTTTK